MTFLALKQPASTRTRTGRRIRPESSQAAKVLVTGDSYAMRPVEFPSWPLYVTPGRLNIINNVAVAGRMYFDPFFGPVYVLAPTDLANNPTTDVFVITSGALNDIGRIVSSGTSTDLDDLKTATESIWADCQAADCWAVWTDAPMTATIAANGPAAALLVAWSEWLAGWCADRNIPCISLYKTFSNSAGLLPEYDYDGVHLNEQGNTKLAQMVEGAVKQIKHRKAV